MSSINWVGVRDEIKALLLTVSGISIVHGFPRFDPDNHIQRWQKLMVSGGRVNAWVISRTAVSTQFLTSKEVQVTTDVLLVGMLQHKDEDATQDEFDELLDNVLEKFFPNYRLNGLDIQGPAQVQLQELRQVANTTVHYAEVTFKTLQRVHI